MTRTRRGQRNRSIAHSRIDIGALSPVNQRSRSARAFDRAERHGDAMRSAFMLGRERTSAARSPQRQSGSKSRSRRAAGTSATGTRAYPPRINRRIEFDLMLPARGSLMT
jgi:hypothetical protein